MQSLLQPFRLAECISEVNFFLSNGREHEVQSYTGSSISDLPFFNSEDSTFSEQLIATAVVVIDN